MLRTPGSNGAAHSYCRTHLYTRSPNGVASGSARLTCRRSMEGEAEELVRKAIELAKAGDVAMLKFLLARIRGSG